MEAKKSAIFHSPVIRKNTPIKRLGLSRKRKSCGSDISLNAKIPAFSDKLTDSPSHSQTLHSDEQHQAQKSNENEIENNMPIINYDEEIQLLQKRIAETEEQLKTLECRKTKIMELENLVDIWKNGCKNVFLHFTELLKERHSENIDFKTILNQLGIWKTMLEHFKNDSEISLSDGSQ